MLSPVAQMRLNHSRFRDNDRITTARWNPVRKYAIIGRCSVKDVRHIGPHSTYVGLDLFTLLARLQADSKAGAMKKYLKKTIV